MFSPFYVKMIAVWCGRNRICGPDSGRNGIVEIYHLLPEAVRVKYGRTEVCHMIKIDEAVLEKAELLAKLRIDASERERTMNEMEKLLLYTEKLNEIDTEGVLPLSHGEPGEAALREDEVTNPDGREQTLANVPKLRQDCPVVPKTV